MCINYMGHNWAADFTDPIQFVEWKFFQGEREDLREILLRPWINMALTEGELDLWCDYVDAVNAGQFDVGKELWEQLVNSMKERGLID